MNPDGPMLVCKAAGDHTWDPPVPSENQERPQVCTVCKARRFTARDRDGEVQVRRYEYARTA